MIKFRWLALFALAVILCSCTSKIPESVLQTAIEQTLAARITDTPQPTNTITPSSTPTITATPTQTATPTPTLTPTPDIRILDISPDKYVLEEHELPVEAKYYIPNELWGSFNTNEETISNWGVEKGREYVLETGRIIGFEIDFARGARDVRAPEELYSIVIVFKSSQGANLAFTKYDRANRIKDWTVEQENIGIGDNSKITKKVISGTGDSKIIAYILNFTYKNILVEIWGYGLEKDITLEFMKPLAEIELRKLQAVPLVYPSTATPIP
jgi:hypothetical protein